MAVTMAQLRRIDELLLVAGGAHKARAVRAAIRAGLGTTLVADDSLARALLELAGTDGSGRPGGA
jgi:DNA-binding transcriptional regulator LsrR (DeoR family)